MKQVLSGLSYASAMFPEPAISSLASKITHSFLAGEALQTEITTESE